MKKYGLVGHPLGHSFSGKYFSEKFEKLGLNDHKYDLFDLEVIEEFPQIWEDDALTGVNITVPHKEGVKRFLSGLNESAEKVGAVNVVKRTGTELIGHNTDAPAFKQTLENWLDSWDKKALVLGTGGSSKAVKSALSDLDIPFLSVSRHESSNAITYEAIAEKPHILKEYQLIINTTPLGMYPKVENKADLPYEELTNGHYLYDLVYNPEVTAFLQKGIDAGAKVKNGLEMLIAQAELSWKIWNE